MSAPPGGSSATSLKKRPQERVRELLQALTEHDVGSALSRFVDERTEGGQLFLSFKRIWDEFDFGLVYTLGLTILPTSVILNHLYDYLLSMLLPLSPASSPGATAIVPMTTVGTVFFLYCLYFSQPCGEDQCPAPIPISESLLRWLRVEFYEKDDLPDTFRDLRYALHRLFDAGAFQICLKSSSLVPVNGPEGPIMVRSSPPGSLEEQREGTANFGMDDLAGLALEHWEELPAKHLKEQLGRIHDFLHQGPVTLATSRELQEVASEYERLLAESRHGDPSGTLSDFDPPRAFLAELSSLRERFSDSPISSSGRTSPPPVHHDCHRARQAAHAGSTASNGVCMGCQAQSRRPNRHRCPPSPIYSSALGARSRKSPADGLDIASVHLGDGRRYA